MDPAAPSPHHRHRSSLEGIIDFSPERPLEIGQRAEAKRKFYHIVNHFEASADAAGSHGGSGSTGNQYNRPALVRLTYEHARSEISQDVFLRAFFQSTALSMDDGTSVDFDDKELEDKLGSAFFGFAEHLFDNFFLPLKASTTKTPQPSPACLSAMERAEGGEPDFIGTQGRLAELRRDCLVRDRYRCVISRQFDKGEAIERWRRSREEAKDGDGNPLLDAAPFEDLEVAHIMPHALAKVGAGSQSHPSKTAALAILNMFDAGVAHLIEGEDIDRPQNAITLNHTLHRSFGSFTVFFTPVSDWQPHTYRIDTFLPRGFLALPVTRTLCLTENRTVDPPSPRLLSLHSAIAHILHLSGAGDYIDQIIRDRENIAREDGSTELARLVTLGLGGWLERTVY